MKQTFIGLLLSAVLLLPGCLFAQPQHRDDRRDHADEHRYYDKKHKDYHEWNDHEAQAYRIYGQQHGRHYTDWDKANERQRNDYWNWRHSHSDSVLKINIR
jgi:outer membrane biogenesis lipoprotein LolB